MRDNQVKSGIEGKLRAEPICGPVFLVGAERSGTTAVRLMLDHHPSVGWVNEFEYVVDMVPDGDGWPDVESYVEWLETHRIFTAAKLTVGKALSYPELVDDFLRQWRERKGKPVVGATVHRHFDRLLRIWPDAKFLHIVRDGRDVAASNIRMGWAGNVWHGIDRWIEAERLWERMRGELGSERYFEFRFEDLITEPDRWLGEICDFLGVERDCDAMLSYPDDTTYSYPDSRLLYQWKRKMGAKDIAVLESRIGGMLTERGYELAAERAAEPGLLGRVWYSVHNRYHKVKFSRRRLGTRLWLGLAIAKRFGSGDWYKRLLLRQNEITRQHLK